MTTAAIFGTRDAASQRLRAHHERHQAAGRDEWAYRAVLDLEATFGMPAPFSSRPVFATRPSI